MNRRPRARTDADAARMRARMDADIEAVWREYAAPLRRFVVRRVGNGHNAEDILQEVFLKAHAGFARVRDRGRIKPWLYRIAENAVADYHRGRARSPVSLDLAAVVLAVPAEAASERGEPENANADVIPCIRSMVDDLPEGYRRALVLADLEGKTQREVAEELGLTVPGAKSRVQRARRKLKATLHSCCRLELDRVGNVLDCERKEKARCSHC